MTERIRWAGIAKLQEEMGELACELGKLHACPDGRHWDNANKEDSLIQRVMNEMADVNAALAFFSHLNFTIEERLDMAKRAMNKTAKFMEWHASEGMTGTK